MGRKNTIGKTCADCGCEVSTNKATRCKTCSAIFRKRDADYSAEWQRKRKYGMEFGEFHYWWIAFQGKCGICKIDLKAPLKQRGQPLDVVAVDHDHKTGKIRGLLCNACNKGLGLFKDDPIILEKARNYLCVN